LFPQHVNPCVIIDSAEVGPITYIMLYQDTNLPPGQIFVSTAAPPTPPPTPIPPPTPKPITSHWWFWLAVIGGGTVALLFVILVSIICLCLHCSKLTQYESIQ